MTDHATLAREIAENLVSLIDHRDTHPIEPWKVKVVGDGAWASFVDRKAAEDEVKYIRGVMAAIIEPILSRHDQARAERDARVREIVSGIMGCALGAGGGRKGAGPLSVIYEDAKAALRELGEKEE